MKVTQWLLSAAAALFGGQSEKDSIAKGESSSLGEMPIAIVDPPSIFVSGHTVLNASLPIFHFAVSPSTFDYNSTLFFVVDGDNVVLFLLQVDQNWKMMQERSEAMYVEFRDLAIEATKDFAHKAQTSLEETIEAARVIGLEVKQFINQQRKHLGKFVYQLLKDAQLAPSWVWSVFELLTVVWKLRALIQLGLGVVTGTKYRRLFLSLFQISGVWEHFLRCLFPRMVLVLAVISGFRRVRTMYRDAKFVLECLRDLVRNIRDTKTLVGIVEAVLEAVAKSILSAIWRYIVMEVLRALWSFFLWVLLVVVCVAGLFLSAYLMKR